MLIVVDEVNFMTIEDLLNLDEYLNILCDDLQSSCKFGDLKVLFTGDFGQLTPPESNLFCEYSRLLLWDNSVNFYLPLRTNHLFKDNEEWGQLLFNFTNEGPTADEINI